MPKRRMKQEQSLLPFEGETVVSQFRDKHIRKVFHEGEWYFSIVDIIEAITDSTSPSRYWTELRNKVASEQEQSDLFDKIEKVKMPGADGKSYPSDAANTETLFRIIQSIPSPKAEPIKRWLAKTGFERLQEIQNPEIAIKRAIITYQMRGYPEDWISERVKTIISRNELTSEWAKRGVAESQEFAILTNVISEETFDLGVQQHKEFKNIGRNDNLRDHMTDIELILTMLGEKSTTSIAQARNAQGFVENEQAAHSGGKIAGDARKNLEQELERSVVSRQNFLPNKDPQDQLIDGGKIRLPG